MKRKLSLIKISNAVSAKRELKAHQGIGIKCMCYGREDHEATYEANRW